MELRTRQGSLHEPIGALVAAAEQQQPTDATNSAGAWAKSRVLSLLAQYTVYHGNLNWCNEEVSSDLYIRSLRTHLQRPTSTSNLSYLVSTNHHGSVQDSYFIPCPSPSQCLCWRFLQKTIQYYDKRSRMLRSWYLCKWSNLRKYVRSRFDLCTIRRSW